MPIRFANVRQATDGDAETIVDYAERINAESGHGLTFNRANALEHVRYFTSDAMPDWVCYLAEIEGTPVGGVMLCTSLEYHDVPLCYVSKFWVMPEGRRTLAARQLVAATVEWAKARNCSHVFVTATAGLDEREQQMFVNLMQRDGFVDAGPVLMKELHHG